MKNILYYFIGFNFFLCELSGNISKEEQELALHHFMQGEFLVDQGNYSLAVLEFQDALDIDPNAPTIHVSIADAYLRLGKNKRAKNHLNTAVELNPDEIEAYEILGKIHLMQKSLSQAEEVYKELVRLDSMNIENYFSLANIARIEKEWDMAIDYYLQAYQINSMAIKGLEQALQICLATNKFDRAEDVCDFLLNEEPDNEKYLETLRDLALFNNDYHKALLTINKLEIIRGPSAQTLIQT